MDKGWLFDTTTVNHLLVFLSANVSACRRGTGNLSQSVFVFVHIRESRQNKSAGKILKHTALWILQ